MKTLRDQGFALLNAGQLAYFEEGIGVVVDVRPFADYARGHLQGSWCCPLDGKFPDVLDWILPRSGGIVVTGADEGQQARGCDALSARGFNVEGMLDGGMGALRRRGHRLPTVAEACAQEAQLIAAGEPFVFFEERFGFPWHDAGPRADRSAARPLSFVFSARRIGDAAQDYLHRCGLLASDQTADVLAWRVR